MPSGGPLIPGLREYDAPRRRRSPVFWVWAIGSVVVVLALVVLGGLVAGIGPLRALGTEEAPLTPVSWRATDDPNLIQVAVALPDAGLCTGDEVVVRAIERNVHLLLVCPLLTYFPTNMAMTTAMYNCPKSAIRMATDLASGRTGTTSP